MWYGCTNINGFVELELCVTYECVDGERKITDERDLCADCPEVSIISTCWLQSVN